MHVALGLTRGLRAIEVAGQTRVGVGLTQIMHAPASNTCSHIRLGWSRICLKSFVRQYLGESIVLICSCFRERT